MTNYTIYRLFDFETGLYVGPEFSRIRDFFNYHICKTFQQDPNCHWKIIDYLDPLHKTQTPCWIDRYNYVEWKWSPRKPGLFQNRYAIKNEYGRSFEDPQELYRIAYYPRNHFAGWRRFYNYDDWDDRCMHLPKKNVNRLKREIWSWYWRGVRTTNEIRQNAAHIAEYGETFVRGKRRRYNIPTSWDDRPNSQWDTRKSWKHNSKRKHQWKEK